MAIVDGKLIITWQVDDVLQQAEDDGVECSPEKAAWILEQMDHYHDCNLGITWETISYWLGVNHGHP